MTASSSSITWNGARPNQGRIIVGREYPGEGYAILRCGNTEIQIGFTMLSDMRFSGLGMDDSRAFNSIICEAALGRTGDDTPGPLPVLPKV